MLTLVDHAKSSLFRKLAPAQRNELDRAIIDRTPPTYRGLYDRFQLAALGMSFAALCRYAKRIRYVSTLGRVAEFTAMDPKKAEGLVAQLVGQHFLDLLLTPEPDHRKITRLANTYCRVNHVELRSRRVALLKKALEPE